MGPHTALEAEHSLSSNGSTGSNEVRRLSGTPTSFRRRSFGRGRASRDGAAPDADDWGKSHKERVELIEALKAELRATPEFSIHDYDSHTLLRFLRARDYSVSKALEMYTNHLRWRKENNIDTILTDFDFTEREAFLGVYPQGYYKTDKLGRPITIQHLGSIDLRKIKEVTTMDRMIKYHIQEYERFLKHIIPVCSKVAGRYTDTTFAILDVKGVSLKMMTGDVRKMLADITKIDQDQYPETLGKTCIINAPFVFKAVWAMIKPMLQPRTVAKITLLGTKYIDELTRFIDIENIPEYMGGLSKNSLIDDAGPWNDPVVLSSLNKIAEDSDRDVPLGFAEFSELERDFPRGQTIRVEASPSASGEQAAHAAASASPPRLLAAGAASASPEVLPHYDGAPLRAGTPAALVDRVRELEALVRDAMGSDQEPVLAPASSTLIARVEFLERSMQLVVKAETEALTSAINAEKRAMQEDMRELAILRAAEREQQLEERASPKPGCCCIM